MRDMIRPWAVLFIITLTAALGLGIVYEITKEPIIIQQENAKKKSLALLLPEASEFIPADNEISASGAAHLYTGYDGGVIKGYIIASEANGYGGPIGVLTAIGADGAVRGIDIYKSSETPGLGENIRNTSFKAQFIGTSGTVAVARYEPGANEIHAVTGATVSTAAAVGAVNAAIDYFNNYLSNGGK